jgi:hypothetical protein
MDRNSWAELVIEFDTGQTRRGRDCVSEGAVCGDCVCGPLRCGEATVRLL